MNTTQEYKIGGQLPTVTGHNNGYTITELTQVPASEHSTTYARYKFVAEDKSRKVKTLDLNTWKHVPAHPRIVGWIDEQGCWFS